MSEETKPEEKEALTEDDLLELKKETERLKASLIGDSTNELVSKTKEDTRAQVEKEMELKQKLEEQERANTELQAKLDKQKEESASKFDDLTGKLDSLIASKQVISKQDPFGSAPPEDSKVAIENLSDEQVDSIEDNSAREFFGSDYDTMNRG